MITLDLSPEIEERLRRKAAQRGQEVADYVRTLAERDAQTDEWNALLDAVSEGSEDWPVLAPEAFERASFYGEQE